MIDRNQLVEGNSMSHAPIAIFLYNRVNCTKRLFECLSASGIFAESPLYVFIDGPKNESDRTSVEAVGNLVSILDHPNLNVHAAKNNKGLRQSIVDGVSLVCRDHDKVIVLEDDLEFDPITLEYFNRALAKYANNSSVFSICGYLPGQGLVNPQGRAIVLPYTHPWGWATWARAWVDFKIDKAIGGKELGSAAFRTSFNLGGLRNFADMLDLANIGEIDSWYIYWYFHIFQRRGVSIFPSQSYIKNSWVGGTHASRCNPLRLVLGRKIPCDYMMDLPERIEVDHWALDEVSSSLEARLTRLIEKIGSLKRRIPRKCKSIFYAVRGLIGISTVIGRTPTQLTILTLVY